jgi:hypothetical protein
MTKDFVSRMRECLEEIGCSDAKFMNIMDMLDAKAE